MSKTSYLLLFVAMFAVWLSIEKDDDDMDGGKMIPAYQRADE